MLLSSVNVSFVCSFSLFLFPRGKAEDATKQSKTKQEKEKKNNNNNNNQANTIHLTTDNEQ
jgi:ribosomal protein L9